MRSPENPCVGGSMAVGRRPGKLSRLILDLLKTLYCQRFQRITTPPLEGLLFGDILSDLVESFTFAGALTQPV
jgi:hypothetical protein